MAPSLQADARMSSAVYVSTDESNDIQGLALKLIEGCADDRERLWRIYDYVTSSISYDNEAYQNGFRRINKDSRDVLRRKKAVCWGYSELMREICTYAGLRCVTITGYARDLTLPNRSFENANHAWNAVLLDGHWHLLDATWGSGILSGEDYFSSVYGVDYFLTPPSLFVKNHYPLLPMWQLLSCPVSLESFYAGTMVVRRDCNFNFNKAIKEYLSMSRLEQEAQTLTIAYRMNRSQKNRKLLGHALVDIATDLKEKGDMLFEVGKKYEAIEQLESALRMFEIARAYCDFYPWQEYGYVFTAINLAQAYYDLYLDDPERVQFVYNQMERTWALFDSSHVDIQVKSHIHMRIREFQADLEERGAERGLVTN